MSECHSGGVISPETCEYIKDWLDTWPLATTSWLSWLQHVPVTSCDSLRWCQLMSCRWRLLSWLQQCLWHDDVTCVVMVTAYDSVVTENKLVWQIVKSWNFELEISVPGKSRKMAVSWGKILQKSCSSDWWALYSLIVKTTQMKVTFIRLCC